MVGGADVLFNVEEAAEFSAKFGHKAGISVRDDLSGDAVQGEHVTLLGHFSFLLPLFPVLLLHLSHACVAPRPLGLASLFLIAPVLLFAWH